MTSALAPDNGHIATAAARPFCAIRRLMQRSKRRCFAFLSLRKSQLRASKRPFSSDHLKKSGPGLLRGPILYGAVYIRPLPSQFILPRPSPLSNEGSIQIRWLYLNYSSNMSGVLTCRRHGASPVCCSGRCPVCIALRTPVRHTAESEKTARCVAFPIDRVVLVFGCKVVRPLRGADGDLLD
jgi:hypothetical protein